MDDFDKYRENHMPSFWRWITLENFAKIPCFKPFCRVLSTSMIWIVTTLSGSYSLQVIDVDNQLPLLESAIPKKYFFLHYAQIRIPGFSSAPAGSPWAARSITLPSTIGIPVWSMDVPLMHSWATESGRLHPAFCIRGRTHPCQSTMLLVYSGVCRRTDTGHVHTDPSGKCPG